MSVCSCINGNIYNGSVTTDPLCPVHGEKAVVACSYPLCPIHFPPNRAPHPAEPTIGLTGADILRALKEPTHWKTQDELAERLNALICTLLADAQEEMRERCAKVADAFEAAYSTGLSRRTETNCRRHPRLTAGRGRRPQARKSRAGRDAWHGALSNAMEAIGVNIAIAG